jgi:glyceraldehyde 3-phosphate dehydrogenase
VVVGLLQIGFGRQRVAVVLVRRIAGGVAARGDDLDHKQRIGRLAFRQIYNLEGIEVVAINDLTNPKVLAHLLKYDSAHGPFGKQVSHSEDAINVEGKEIKIYAQKDPSQLPWKQHDVDVVLECTGFFTDKAKAEAHIAAGAKRVVISAPATGDLKLLCSMLTTIS